MADDNDRMTNADMPAIVAPPAAPKQQRKPRTKKIAAELASSDLAAEPTTAPGTMAVRQRERRKPKSLEGAGSAERTPMKRGSKIVQTSVVAPPAAIDEMADLLLLEAENQKLRKLLAAKLRAENAELLKRLKIV